MRPLDVLLARGGTVAPPSGGLVIDLPFTGADGSTDFTDGSGKAWTGTSATISTTLGYSALKLNDGSSYLVTDASADFDLGGGDFQIIANVYLTASPTATYRPILVHDNIAVTRGWLLLADQDISGKIAFAMFSDNATHKGVRSMAACPQNVLIEIDVRRVGGELTMRLDGVLQDTVDVTGFVVQNPATKCQIGALRASGFPSPTNGTWAGYIKSIELYKG